MTNEEKKELLNLLLQISYGFDAYEEEMEDARFWRPWSAMQEYLLYREPAAAELTAEQVEGFRESIAEMHAIYADENRISWSDADDIARDVAYDLEGIIGGAEEVA